FAFIIMAARWTIVLAVVSFVGGAFGASLVAIARTSKFGPLRTISASYILVFQGTPVLLQIFLAYFLPSAFGVSISPFAAAVIGLSLRGSAYFGEIWRGAIESVPNAQWEAAESLSLNYRWTMVKI